MPETYENEEAQQILQLAMLKQGKSGSLLRSQLFDIAEDLGISATTLAAAEEEWQGQLEEQQARQEFTSFRHRQLRRNIVQHLAVNSALVLLNGVTSHRIDWAVYPAMIWAIAIFWEAWQVLWPEDEQYNRAFRRWRLRQQIGESFKMISERFKSAPSPSDSAEETNGSGDRQPASKSENTSAASIDPPSEFCKNPSGTPPSTLEISVVALSDKGRDSDSGQPNPTPLSPAQKSRLQNRLSNHHSGQHRGSHFLPRHHQGHEQNDTDQVS
jgi:hypothetical protein